MLSPDPLIQELIDRIQTAYPASVKNNSLLSYISALWVKGYWEAKQTQQVVRDKEFNVIFMIEWIRHRLALSTTQQKDALVLDQLYAVAKLPQELQNAVQGLEQRLSPLNYSQLTVEAHQSALADYRETFEQKTHSILSAYEALQAALDAALAQRSLVVNFCLQRAYKQMKAALGCLMQTDLEEASRAFAMLFSPLGRAEPKASSSTPGFYRQASEPKVDLLFHRGVHKPA